MRARPAHPAASWGDEALASALALSSVAMAECGLLLLGGKLGSLAVATKTAVCAAAFYCMVGALAAVVMRTAAGFRNTRTTSSYGGAGPALYLACMVLDRARVVSPGSDASRWTGLAFGIVLGAAIFAVSLRCFGRYSVFHRPGFWGGAAATMVAVFLAGAMAVLGAAPLRALAAPACLLAAVLAVIGAGRRTRRGGQACLAVSCLVSLSIGVLSLRPVPISGMAVGQERPNVLLITIDTLRADHLGCYGYAAASTPNLDRLAVACSLFEDAVANSVVTGPSHMTILSGLLPVQHGALRNGMPLDRSISTLGDILRDIGYRTAAFVSGWTLTNAMTGLEAHFHHYDDDLNITRWVPDEAFSLQLFRLARHVARAVGCQLVPNDRPAAAVTDRCLSWLARHDAEPFFVWLHYFDPHLPYDPPSPYDAMYGLRYDGPADGDWYALTRQQRSEIIGDADSMRRMNALYDGEISYVDTELGRVLDYLKQRQLDNNLLLVVAADHGESMGEHGVYFGRELYEPSLRVPLLIKLPGGAAPQRHSRQASLADVFPTVLDALEISVESKGPGVSLVPRIFGDATGSVPPAIAAQFSHSGRPNSRWAVRHDGHKLIWSSSRWVGDRLWPDKGELYDLRSDPGETMDRIDRDAVTAALLRQKLLVWRPEDAPDAEPRISGEEMERLRALGYVDE